MNQKIFLYLFSLHRPADFNGYPKDAHGQFGNYFVRSNQMLSPITIYGTSSVLVIIGRKNMPFPPSYSVSMFSLQPFYSVQFAVQALPATCRA